jgi:arylsulfatase A-like enzyme
VVVTDPEPTTVDREFPGHSTPNVVLIVLDTQRVDRLSCYGYPRPTTPNIDSFAARSTLFERAISPAQWTIPAHASLFTGEMPCTHLALQAYDALDANFETLASRLWRVGYRTTGICNNPLVGVLENEFRRGFDSFHNYGGTVQSPWISQSKLERHVALRLRDWLQRKLRRFTAKIENVFTRPNLLFRLAMNPALVPLWSRHSRFKGDTPASLGDTVRFMRKETGPGRPPHFLFLNLMQTHLPFAPRQAFVNRFAPLVNENDEAGDFMRGHNSNALRWMLPLTEPLSELHAQTLSDMYDAEVAYQDHLLADLLNLLNEPWYRDNTLVVVVSDHGEMLGEHQLTGHGLGAFQELAHVPLIIRWPGQTRGRIVGCNVSTRRVFHTVLEAVGLDGETDQVGGGLRGHSHSLNWAQDTIGDQADAVFCEAYPPETLLQLIETNVPSLIHSLHARSPVRALYHDNLKLIEIEDQAAFVYDLLDDPGEQQELSSGRNTAMRRALSGELARLVSIARSRQPENWTREAANLSDEDVKDRLRGLGYLA